MKKITKLAFLSLFVLSLIPFTSADSKLQIQLKAFNVTQNQDATTVNNRPGDILRYTADVKNQGPDDLVDYEMRIFIRDLLQYGTIVDLGGGVIEGDYIKYPPILQAVSCNCTNSNYFKIKLKDNVCEVTSLTATYEDISVTVPVRCEAAPPTPGITQVPRPPKSGPTETLMIAAVIALLGGGGFVIWRKKRAGNV